MEILFGSSNEPELNTVNLNKQGTRKGTVNTSLRHKFGIPRCLSLESKSKNGVLQQHVLLCLVFQVLPDISSCEVPHIFNEAKLIDISVEGILII